MAWYGNTPSVGWILVDRVALPLANDDTSMCLEILDEIASFNGAVALTVMATC